MAALLTHPDFIKSHRNTLIHKHRLIFYNIPGTALYSNSYDEPILKPSDYIHGLTIHGSCNGLVLVCAENEDFVDIPVLFNPSTKESMLLPEYFDNDSNVGAYEYFESDYMRGLGYDSETGDFKVVSLFCVHHTVPETPGLGLMYGHVYSLKTNTWRQLTNSVVDYCSIARLRESVFANGFLHWIATKTVNGLESTVILAFSLADDKFSEVPTPEFVESNEYLSSDYCRLVVLGGKLALFHGLNGEIWLMNGYRIKESWTNILLHGIPTVTPHPYIWAANLDACSQGKTIWSNS